MTENTSPVAAEKSVGPVQEVRQWRVGTMSMGLTLVILGLVIFLGKVSDAISISWMLNLWPIILIILGLEMVLLNVLTVTKGSRLRFTYDILSIFLVLVLLFASSVLVVLESSGVLDLADRLWVSERYIESEKVLYTVDEDLRALTLKVEGRRVNLRTYDGDEIKVLTVYRGYFASQEEGLEYAEDQYVQVERLGQTLLVDIYPPGQGYAPQANVGQEVTIFIPRHLDVELNQSRGDVNITLLDLTSNWVINHQANNRYLDLTLDGVTDAKLSVEVSGNGQLQGNIQWDSELDGDEEGKPSIEASKTWGDGRYSLILRQTSGTIAANIR